MIIDHSVGAKATNSAPDVRLVQRLLNDHRGRHNQVLLLVDGIAGPKTIGAISEYQQQNRMRLVDGLVNPTGPTIAHLVEALFAGLSAGMVQIPSLPGFEPEPLKPTDLDKQTVESYLRKLRV